MITNMPLRILPLMKLFFTTRPFEVAVMDFMLLEAPADGRENFW